MSARVYETISRHQVGPWNIRIWQEAEISGLAPGGAAVANCLAELHERIMFDSTCDLSINGIRDLLLDLPGVAAVEITDDTGKGCLGYNDWP